MKWFFQSMNLLWRKWLTTNVIKEWWQITFFVQFYAQLSFCCPLLVIQTCQPLKLNPFVSTNSNNIYQDNFANVKASDFLFMYFSVYDICKLTKLKLVGVINIIFLLNVDSTKKHHSTFDYIKNVYNLQGQG